MSCDKNPEQEPSRWMALDIGSKRIGVAISDPLKLTARPLITIERESIAEDVQRLVELAKKHKVTRMVVGNPINLSGTRSSILTHIESFVATLEKETNLTIDWADERLSTKEAESLMREHGIEISRRRATRDQYAAALILTWYLEEKTGES